MTNLCLVVQEEKLKRPLSDMQVWEIAHTRKDSKPGEPHTSAEPGNSTGS